MRNRLNDCDQGGLTDNKAVRFELIEAKVREGGSLWLRYKVKQNES